MEAEEEQEFSHPRGPSNLCKSSAFFQVVTSEEFLGAQASPPFALELQDSQSLLAAGNDKAALIRPHDFTWLMNHKPLILAAVSTGAVFMGANSYIGNGPNFMVKAIADEAGVKTPSFFGYMLYSGLILIPVFLIMTLVFF